MPMYLASSPELDENLEAMVNELKNYLKLVTGKDISIAKTVAFAVYYTLHMLPSDERRLNKIKDIFQDKDRKSKLENGRFIDKLLETFRDWKNADVKEILLEEVKEDNATSTH